GQEAAIAVIRQRSHSALMTGKHEEDLTGRGVPDAHGSIAVGRGELPAIGTIYRAQDDPGVSTERVDTALGPPLEVVPFPGAQARLAGFEQFVRQGQLLR